MSKLCFIAALLAFGLLLLTAKILPGVACSRTDRCFALALDCHWGKAEMRLTLTSPPEAPPGRTPSALTVRDLLLM